MTKQVIDHITANQFQSRAMDFIQGSATLCAACGQGWLASSAFLIGQAFELLAKQRLLLQGVPKETLSRRPYGHDLRYLCGEETRLREEASLIAEEFLKRPSPDGVDEGFRFDLHFEAMADAHSGASHFSLRYHEGVRSFADPRAMTVILGEIARRERMQHSS